MDEINNFTIEKIFMNPVKSPFSYNLSQIVLNNNIEHIFNQIKNIFTVGLLHVTNKYKENDNGKIIDLDRISEEDISKVKEYMLSMGIDVIYKKYNKEDIDYHIRSVIYAIENIKDIQLEIVSDWKTQYIKNLHIKIKPEQGEELTKILKKYPESNYFLGLYKPETMKDYKIQYVKKEDPNIVHIINFKAANITDYHYHHPHMDMYDKHVR